MRFRAALPLLIVVPALGVPPGSAAASGSTGGVTVPNSPAIAAVTCADGRSGACARGAALTLTGTSLESVKAVTFLGKAGRRDDRTAKPARQDEASVVVTVPTGTRSGPIAVASFVGTTRGPRVRISGTVTPATVIAAEPAVPADPGIHVFPISGQHDYGTLVNTFGGGRGHRGQDVAAACGTPLVAATAGTVLQATYDGRGGNYVVVQRGDGRSEVYMHLRRAATVRKGEAVAAGQRIGDVGASGDAVGCHLHFESWTAPGWYRGGRAVDPLPQLRSWDQAA